MRRAFTVLIVIVILGVVAFLLQRALSRYDLSEIREALISIPPFRLMLAGCFAAASYLCLTGFDALAVRYVGHRLPYSQTALASFTALSLGHSIGFAALSSGAVRYRFYSRWGLSRADVARVIIFCGVTVGLGLATLAGAALLLHTDLAEAISGLERSPAIILGLLLLAAPLTYLVLAAAYRGRIGFGHWSMRSPHFSLAVGQVALGTANFAMVAACLYQTLAITSDVSYGTVAAIYAIANATAIVSHVPGGLGVLEGVVLFLLPGAPVLAALIVFRVVYFLVPLVLGGAVLAMAELAMRRRTGRPGEVRPATCSPGSATTDRAGRARTAVQDRAAT